MERQMTIRKGRENIEGLNGKNEKRKRVGCRSSFHCMTLVLLCQEQESVATPLGYFSSLHF